jgi:hypothetical protein
MGGYTNLINLLFFQNNENKLKIDISHVYLGDWFKMMQDEVSCSGDFEYSVSATTVHFNTRKHAHIYLYEVLKG